MMTSLGSSWESAAVTNMPAKAYQNTSGHSFGDVDRSEEEGAPQKGYPRDSGTESKEQTYAGGESRTSYHTTASAGMIYAPLDKEDSSSLTNRDTDEGDANGHCLTKVGACPRLAWDIICVTCC